MIEGFLDFDRINQIKCDKALVEFPRVNSWIRKWFDIDYSDYTEKQSGYLHLHLKKKKELLGRLTGFKEVTVCEDFTEHYDYWRDHFNPNPEDCAISRSTRRSFDRAVDNLKAG